MALVFALLCALLAVLIYGAVVYNRLNAVKTNADKSWSGIDFLLKQRYDEIPKLVKICESYMKYERENFDIVKYARTKFLEADTPARLIEAGSEISKALMALFAVAENYPALKTNENYMQLQGRVKYLEVQLAERVAFYNDSAAAYNMRMKHLPDAAVARLVGYSRKELFKVR